MNSVECNIKDTGRIYKSVFCDAKKHIDSKIALLNDKEKSDYIKNSLLLHAKDELSTIIKCKERYKCKRCAVCCKFALSAYSPDELKKRAEKGDKYSKEFISVFVLYENKKDVCKIYPEYCDYLKTLNLFDSLYFYHCPHIICKNGVYGCARYEKRPDICKDFPNNPLVFMYPECGFQDWKNDYEIKSLYLNAIVEISEFYLKNIPETAEPQGNIV